MVTLSKLLSYLNDLYAPNEFNDYCPNGLQVEGLKPEIKKIATAVSASLETIEYAIDSNFDALIVHHGLFWKGDSFEIVASKRKKIAKLLSSGIHLFAYHLPMDAHPKIGNNWAAAKEMKWKNLQSFGPKVGPHSIGVQGQFEPITTQAFKKQLEDYYGHAAHHAPCTRSTVQSAALISGGAHKEIEQAYLAGVDCFITGSFDEPTWHLAKELNIHFFALGHSHTEKVGPKALAKKIQSDFEVDCTFIDFENPF